MVTWALGWAHYCNGDLGAAERVAARRPSRSRRPADQWIVGVARARGPVADRRACAGAAPSRCGWRREAVDLARERGLLDAVEDGEVHTALGVALAADGRRDEALPELEQGVFLRRLWRQPLDLVDGLLALAPAVAALGDRDARRRALRRGGGARRRAAATRARCRARLAAARRAGAAVGRPTARRGAELSERERTVLRLLAGGLSEREIGRELYVSFNTVHTHVRSVYRKLGVSSRAEAVARARERLL